MKVAPRVLLSGYGEMGYAMNGAYLRGIVGKT